MFGLISSIMLYGCGSVQQTPAVIAPELTYASQEALNGRPLGTITGTITGTILDIITKEYFPQSSQHYYNSYADCVTALKQGKIDGFICDEPIARMIALENPGVSYIKKPLAEDVYGIGINKKKAFLKKILDEGLARYKQNGNTSKLEAIWFSKDEDLKKLPAFKPGSKGKIIAAVSADSPPMVYVKNNQIIGFETALVMSILQDAGYELECRNMDLAAEIPAVVSGKVYIYFSCASITEERKKSMLFSAPDYTGGLVAMVRLKSAAATEAGLMAVIKESFRRNFMVEERYKMILAGLKTTIFITVCAAILGTILGFGVCLLRRSRSRLGSSLAYVFVKVMQGTPLVVFLMIMYYIVFGKASINPIYVAIIAFAINMAAYTSEMMRTGIEAVAKGQWEAAYAMGFSKFQTFSKIVAPQALKQILPVYTGEFISMLKMTSVVGYIAIQDLTKMSDIIRSRTYEAFFPLIVTALIYLVVAWSLTSILVYLEYKIDPKKRPRTLKGVKL